MSGVQAFASIRFTRNLPPSAWIALRKANSGSVPAFLRPARCAPFWVGTQRSLMELPSRPEVNFRSKSGPSSHRHL